MFVLNASKSAILELAQNSSVTLVDIHESYKEFSESNIANTNSGASRLADLSSTMATGSGVRIGMLEYNGRPDINFMCGSTSVFDSNNMYFINIGVVPEISSHATLVAALMVGQEVIYNGITYKGIVPDAELYYASYTGNDDFYIAVEELVKAKVDIINMSAGALEKNAEHSTYDNRTLWVDFIIRIQGIHFVKSAGNYSDNNIHSCVTSPGLAYNAITVGSFDDKNNLIGAFSPSNLAFQTLNSDKFYISLASAYITGIGERFIYKPDLVAMGTNVAYANIFTDGSNSGTSFATPQVAGMIAQLCQIFPVLKTNPLRVKALLMAGAVYRLTLIMI